jgi:hypothetical protein
MTKTNKNTANIISKIVIVLLTFIQLAGIFWSNSPAVRALAPQEKTYLESLENTPNPERGFDTPVIDSQNLASINYQKNLYGRTLFRQIYRLDSYINSPLPQSFLEQIDIDAQNYRLAGLKIILNFQYSHSPTANPTDATKSVILGHIN